MKNLTAIITGGTSGIGLAVVKKFLNQNYNCAVVGRSEKKFRDANFNNTNVKFIAADVGVVENCTQIVNETVQTFGRIDTLINCAGIYTEGAINFVDEKTFDEIFKTNVKGTFFMCKAAVDELIKTR